MTYDAPDVLAAFHAQEQLGYPLLADENAKHAIAFDVLNENHKPGDFAYGVARPGVLHIAPGWPHCRQAGGARLSSAATHGGGP